MISGYLPCAFDLLNVGDLDLIAQARQLCDRLVVGVWTDDEVHRRTGRHPVVPFEERMELVRHVRGVDAVLEHPEGADVIGRCQVVFAVDDHDDRAVQSVSEVCAIVPRRSTASRELVAALAPVAGAA